MNAAHRANEHRVKVLIMIKGLGLGGAEKLLVNSIPYLNKGDFEYMVGYFLPWKNALVDDIEKLGLKVACFNISQHWNPLNVKRLKNYLDENKIELVHAHLPYSGLIGRLASKLAHVKFVYTEHNVWGRLNPVMRVFNRLTYGLNDHVIAVSQEVANSIKGVKPNRLSIIENAVDCKYLGALLDESKYVREEFGIHPNDFIIGNVANLSPKKNHENLIRAFALFHKDNPDSTLVIVGQPFNRLDTLQDLALRLGVANRVVFTGGRKDAPRIMKAFDIFSLSSDFEGLPVAMLEAMALAKPIVATSVGGIPEVVRDGIDGCLVPSGRPDLLTEKFYLLFNDIKRRDQMGHNSVSRVKEKYDISLMVSKIESIYRQVLENRKI